MTAFREFLTNRSKTTYSRKPYLCNSPEETTCVKNFPDVCYYRHLHCIYEWPRSGIAGCRNGGHLSNCQLHECSYQFKCPNAYCVPVHTLCDNKHDCPNGEDETNCHPISCPGFLLCRHDKLCVHPYDVWQNHVKCPKSKDDKALAGLSRCPSHCTCLGYAISCKSSKVNSLPPLSPSLRVLLLDYADIKMDSINYRKGNVFLLYLRVTNAKLHQLEYRHMSKLLFLKNLNLSHNDLKSLKPRIFLSLQNLKLLDLSYNMLESLYPDIFIGVTSLTQLNLNHNDIQLLAHCTFGNLHQLQILRLSNNKLSHLGENILCSLRLKELDVNHNYFSVIDGNTLTYQFQYLRVLNTAPLRICCSVSKEFTCHPMVKLTHMSSCSRLIVSQAIRGMLWFSSAILFALISLAIGWFIHQIRRKAQGKNVYNILLIFLFASNLYVCFYCFTILSIDYLSAGYYSFFDDIWRHHILCGFLNTLSYAFFQISMCLSLLISCTRTVAVLYPFKAQNISLRNILIFAFMWVAVSITLGYSGVSWLFPGFVNAAGSALCLGLLLPATVEEDKHVLWHMLVFILPTGLLLLCICISQCMQLKQLKRQMEKRLAVPVNLATRKRASHMTLAALSLTLIQYCPLLVTHILALCQVSLNTMSTLNVTLWSLFLVPSGNTVLYFLVSNGFRHVLIKLFCYF